MGGNFWKWAGLVIAIVALVAIPFLVTSTYYLGIMIFIGINTIVATGLCLLMGYAGQVSLGHAAFYGMGAYFSAVLTTSYGVAPWQAMVVGAIVTGGIAYIIGIPILRLKGHYLAMATLGLGIIVQMIFVNWVDMTGGPSGVTAIPYIKLGPFLFDRDFKYFYLVWAFALAVILISLNIVNSRVGRALRSIHGSETAAEAMGVDTSRCKVQVFTLSAVYASLGGSLYAHYLTFVNPSPFGFMFSIELVAMVVVGGVASIWGAFLGSGMVTALTELLRAWIPKFLGHASGEYEIIFFGIILIVVLIFVPGGLAEIGKQFRQRAWRHTGGWGTIERFL